MKKLFLTLALTVAAAPAYAQTTGLTLSCTGTAQDTGQEKPDDLGPPMGIAVAAGQVSFGDFGSVPITRVTPSAIDFHGVSQTVVVGLSAAFNIDGNIDRVSGDTTVTVYMAGIEKPTVTTYRLTCRPAQRLF